MTKRKRRIHSVEKSLKASMNDALSRELRAAARFLVDLYLARKRPKMESRKQQFDD